MSTPTPFDWPGMPPLHDWQADLLWRMLMPTTAEMLRAEAIRLARTTVMSYPEASAVVFRSWRASHDRPEPAPKITTGPLRGARFPLVSATTEMRCADLARSAR